MRFVGRRMVRRLYLEILLRSQLWGRRVEKCQRRISSLDPNPYYVEHYRAAEALYWWHVPKWLSRDFGSGREWRCLDVGAGYGTLALFCHDYLHAEVTCVDWTSRYFTSALAAKSGFTFLVRNIELDDVGDLGSFDAIVFTEVLEHLNFSPAYTLRTLGGLLRPKGRVYLSTPDAAKWGRVVKYYGDFREMPAPTRALSLVDDHVYQYTLEEIQELAAGCGFGVVRLAYAPGEGRRHLNVVLNWKGAQGRAPVGHRT
jgi:2-polyprenyl-3-methyl-5-hydroxy-6-metoxy-1,4-benzoquinol methylase